MALSSHDLPGARTGLIGREHPVSVLHSAIGRTAHSHGGLLLITGEAGVGKSSLATAAVEEARRTGALVLSGSCWDSDGVPDLWPWIQVGRALRRAADLPGAARIDQGTWEALAVLFGENTGDPGAGFALFDALTEALVSLARNRPVLVVLEDLHWADTASLDVLEFVAQHTWFERVLVVGTYRDAEVENEGHHLQSRLASLASRAVTLALSGLEPKETGALVERTAGRRPDEETVEALHRWTGGNPFFVEQAARLWQGGSGATTLAPGVREAVRRRLDVLPEPVRGVLTTAALLGREFHRQILAAVSRQPDARVDRLLEQAAVAKLVVIQGGGHCAFSHDLVRETLEADLTEGDRAAAHLSVVRAADRSPRIAGMMSPPDLARHAYSAGEDLDAERAVELLARAAEDAAGRLAGEESLRHYRRALERADSLAPRPRVLLILDYSAMLSRWGEESHAGREYERALELSSQAREPELFARVVLSLPHTCQEGSSGRWEELVAEAHRGLLPDRTRRGTSAVQAREVLEHLVRRARERNDDEALTFALSFLHTTVFGAGSARERLALSREIEQLARQTDDQPLVHIASALQWVALLQLGDPRYLEQFRTFAARARNEGAPLFVLVSQIDQAIVSGILGDFGASAEALAEAHRFAPGTGKKVGGGDELLKHEEWGLLLLQGRHTELEELYRRPLQRPTPLLAGLQQAIAAVQRGDAAAARAFLDEHEDGEPPNGTAPLWWRLRAQVAAATRDPGLSERARGDLAPYSGEWLVSMYGFEIGGPADLWLGRVEAAQGRWEPALEHLRAAVASARALRSRPWTVEALLALAETLLDRADDGDGDAALALLDEAGDQAAGMHHVPARVARQRERAAAGPAPVDSGPDHEFRFDSGTWSLRFAGAVVHMPDAKGLRDLHLLLSSPGVDVPAVRLVNPAGGAEAESAARMGGDDVLDERAKAEFRRRLTELDELIEQAEALGDDERAAARDRERAALLGELRSAAGLGGRPRRLGDAAERARKTVTARIRDTLGRLDRRHPELAAHLRESVSTGAHCSYRPDTRPRWRL
ncbi:ATP-binding protein [Nocardiopsis nanhaiensis]